MILRHFLDPDKDARVINSSSVKYRYNEVVENWDIVPFHPGSSAIRSKIYRFFKDFYGSCLSAKPGNREKTVKVMGYYFLTPLTSILFFYVVLASEGHSDVFFQILS